MTLRSVANRGQKAFTLIELLVVIAIIAILAAILFPVFAQAKRAAKDASALSGIKQTGTGLMIYTNDYDDSVILWEYRPTAIQPSQNDWTPWPATMYPYTKNTDIYFDPSRSKTVKVTGDPNANVGGWGWQVHMAINRQAYAGDGDQRSRTLTSFPSVAERMAFAYGEPQVNFNGSHWFDNNRAACPSLANTPANNGEDYYNQIARSAVKYHGDGIISAFADGHAKKIPYLKMSKNNANFGASGQCEKDTFGGADGVYNTPDDPDTERTRYWGRFWDQSY